MGFLRSFSIAMGANLVLFVLSFLNNKLIYIVLGQEENGIYFLIMRFSLFISLLFGEWLRLTNINIAGRDKSLNPVLSANNITYIGSISGLLVLAALFIPSLFTGLIPSQYIFAAIAVGLCLILKVSFQSLLLVNNHMIRYGTTLVLWGLLFLVLDFFFLVIYNLGLNAVILALIISTVIAALWSFISSISVNGFSFRPSLRVFGMSGKMGLRAAVAVLGMFIMINVHPFALRSLEGWAMVAIFSVCFRVFQLFQRGSDVTGTILYSHVAQKDEKSGYRLTMLVCRNLLFISLTFAIIGGFLGKYLIIIIANSTYLDAYLPLLIMLPGIVLMNTGTVLNSSYWGRGYPFKVIIAPYAAGIIGLAIDILLVPEFGTSGAALSFSVMSVVWFIYLVEIFRRDSGFRIIDILVPSRSEYANSFLLIKSKFLTNNRIVK